MTTVGDVVAALLPSVGVGLVFWYAMRAIIRADRKERAAMARWERETEGVSTE